MSYQDISDLQYSDSQFNDWRQLEKDVTLSNVAGSGKQGIISLFTVTGSVVVKVVGICSTNIAGASSTIEVGTTGKTAGIIAQSTGTDIDAGEIWHDAAPDSPIELSSVIKENIVANGLDIFATVATADITGGALKFICLWKPLTKDGKVTSA